MSKDATEKKLKKEKKEKKKEKRAEADGVVKVKKDKKEKKVKVDGELVEKLEAELDKDPETSIVRVDTTGDVVMQDGEPKGALVPFALPLAEDAKEVKKILRTVKKCKLHSAQCSTSLVFLY